MFFDFGGENYKKKYLKKGNIEEKLQKVGFMVMLSVTSNSVKNADGCDQWVGLEAFAGFPSGWYSVR